MTYFVELTDTCGYPILVNMDQVAEIRTSGSGQTLIEYSIGMGVNRIVKESIEAIKKLIVVSNTIKPF